jgi:hypothetical protein
VRRVPPWLFVLLGCAVVLQLLPSILCTYVCGKQGCPAWSSYMALCTHSFSEPLWLEEPFHCQSPYVILSYLYQSASIVSLVLISCAANKQCAINHFPSTLNFVGNVSGAMRARFALQAYTCMFHCLRAQLCMRKQGNSAFVLLACMLCISTVTWYLHMAAC